MKVSDSREANDEKDLGAKKANEEGDLGAKKANDEGDLGAKKAIEEEGKLGLLLVRILWILR